MYVLILFVLAMFVFSGRSVVMKVLRKKISVETVLVMLVGINFFLVLISYLLFFDKKRIAEDMELLTTSPDAPVLWSILVFAGMVSVGFGYVYYHAISVYKLYHISLLLATLPVFTLISAYFLLGEKITPTHLISMVIIIFGLVVLEYDKGILT